MRKTPFVLPEATPVIETVEKVVKEVKEQPETVDLLSRLSIQPKLNTAPVDLPKFEFEEDKEQETSKREPGIENDSEKGEKVETSSFEDFKENVVKKKFADWHIKPEKLSSWLIKTVNQLRVFFLPGVYAKISGFSDEELKDAIEADRVRKEFERKGEAPLLTADQERILKYYDNLRDAQSNISYTQEEIDEFSKIIASRISTMDVPAWMEKYDWILFLLYVEWSHANKAVFNGVGKRVDDKFRNL